MSDFLESAAQQNTGTGIDADYTFNVENPLSQDSDFVTGLQPGDITKYLRTAVADRFQRVHHQSERHHLCRLERHLSGQRERRGAAQGYQDVDHDVVAGASAAAICRGLGDRRKRPHLCVDQLDAAACRRPMRATSRWSPNGRSCGFIIRNPFLPPTVYDTAATGADYIYVSVEPQER